LLVLGTIPGWTASRSNLSGQDRGLTGAETEFLTALLSGRSWLDVWRHSDADGTPWLIVSLDVSKDGSIVETIRLDFDGSTIAGGRSPASLNWDSGVRADEAGVDTSSNGISATGSLSTLARVAGDWFDERRRLGMSS
jgi:hypothetical protein